MGLKRCHSGWRHKPRGEHPFGGRYPASERRWRSQRKHREGPRKGNLPQAGHDATLTTVPCRQNESRAMDRRCCSKRYTTARSGSSCECSPAWQVALEPTRIRSHRECRSDNVNRTVKHVKDLLATYRCASYTLSRWVGPSLNPPLKQGRVRLLSNSCSSSEAT